MAKAPEKTDVASVAKIFYQPLDDGDPHTVTWHGHVFQANVPKDIDRTTHAEMIKLAKGNPWFSVDGKRHRRVKPDREPVPPPGSESEIGDDVDDKKMVEVD